MSCGAHFTITLPTSNTTLRIAITLSYSFSEGKSLANSAVHYWLCAHKVTLRR
ncbi:Uncharacterised protein [Vibrio cholerae]|nr:Uncharacterised protein [Vibrio cholerae]